MRVPIDSVPERLSCETATQAQRSLCLRFSETHPKYPSFGLDCHLPFGDLLCSHS